MYLLPDENQNWRLSRDLLGHGMSLGFFQQRNHLFAFDTRKAIQKIFNGIAGFKVIEETLHRHARTDKDRITPKNLGILNNHLAHS